MPTKRPKKSAKKVKSLSLKSTSAKRVKGGYSVGGGGSDYNLSIKKA